MSTQTLRGKVMLRRSNDLIRGMAPDSPCAPGWAMGSFYPAESAAHAEFEIKEWGASPDGATYNREWQSHHGEGSEFIRVVTGTLTIMFGKSAMPDGGVESFDTIELTAGDSVVLPEGLMRRYRGSHDVSGLTVRRSGLRR